MENARSAFTRRGGLACEEPTACAIGLRVLEKGGNAVDAAVATSLALAVTVPHLGGVGGDYFAMIRLPSGEVRVLNGSGQSPAALTRELLVERGYGRVPERGPLSITVPGMIGALYELWRSYGSIEWSQLVEPSIRLAIEGFPAHRALYKSIERWRGLLEKDPGSRSVILHHAPRRPGSIVRNEALARLLEIVAEDPWAFYRGWPASEIARYVQERGGVLSEEDLARYRPVWASPVRLGIGEWTVLEMPPNTQGVTTLHILGLLPWGSIPRSSLALARHVIDAALPAYRLRDEELGDPASMRRSVESLLSRDTFDDLRGVAHEYSGRPCLAPWLHRHLAHGRDTTFYVVADPHGMVVAGIQSLFHHWGSGLTVPSIGVTLNSRASGFTMRPGLPNTVGPGKRPLHTLSAVMAVRGQELIALGTSGGHYRPQQHALMLAPMLEHGEGPGAAIAAPRALWAPGTCRIVADSGEARALEALGLEVAIGRTGVAAGLRLWAEEGVLEIAADPRGDGFPAMLA